MASKYTELPDGRWRAAFPNNEGRLEYARAPLRVVCGNCRTRYAAHKHTCPACRGAGGEN